ncbi:MAG: HAD-IA family hydrolase [Rhodothermales bacterium]|nr:HAD-IA family hydrolase [Rhodothermales bacterium]
MPDIRFIYFDLDDTLLDHGHAERQALTATVQQYDHVFNGHDLQEILTTYHRTNLGLWRDYALGNISKQDLKDRRFAGLVDSFGVSDVDPAELSNCYLSHYSNHWQYCRGADRVFHQLADSFPVGVITNGFETTQIKKLDAFTDLRDRLSALVISETTGYLKPDGRLFEFAAAKAGLSGAEILYVGDSYESDVEGAQDAGWNVAWYVPDETRRRETDAYVFEDWAEFDLGKI